MPLKDVLFSFHGRLSRRVFWIAWFSTAASWLIVSSAVLSAVESEGFYEGKRAGFVFGILALVTFVLYMFIACWVMLAINAKRWPGIAPLGYKAPFSLRGRINRETFWAAFVSILAVALFVLPVVQSIPGTSIRTNEAGALAFLLFLVVLLWVGLAIQVQRLHDRNDSGLMVVYWLIPLAGIIIIFVHLGYLKGTIGPNKFGDDPLDTRPSLVAK